MLPSGNQPLSQESPPLRDVHGRICEKPKALRDQYAPALEIQGSAREGIVGLSGVLLPRLSLLLPIAREGGSQACDGVVGCVQRFLAMAFEVMGSIL